MLQKIFEELDVWVEQENGDIATSGGIRIPFFQIKVLGQTALAEIKIDLDLFETQDLDAYVMCEERVKQKLDDLLRKINKQYDFLSQEIWMPRETEYKILYKSKRFEASVALPEYVLISKALKAPTKNRTLILEYLAKKPTDLFFNLAKAYGLDLTEFF